MSSQGEIFHYSNGELKGMLILKARFHSEHSFVPSMEIGEDALYYCLNFEIVRYSLSWSVDGIGEPFLIFE